MQLCQVLGVQFAHSITGAGHNELERAKNFYSRAVAAYVLVHEAGAELQQAVDASIDGGGDHGIDSVYIGADGTLWLIQSKYIASGRGEPELGDVAKFRDGVTD